MNTLTEAEFSVLHPAAQALRMKVGPAALFAADKLVSLEKAAASDIASELGLPVDTAERALRDLVRVGVARRHGPRSGGGWAYVWVGA